jgi:hypothetical protein
MKLLHSTYTIILTAAELAICYKKGLQSRSEERMLVNIVIYCSDGLQRM